MEELGDRSHQPFITAGACRSVVPHSPDAKPALRLALYHAVVNADTPVRSIGGWLCRRRLGLSRDAEHPVPNHRIQGSTRGCRRRRGRVKPSLLMEELPWTFVTFPTPGLSRARDIRVKPR